MIRSILAKFFPGRFNKNHSHQYYELGSNTLDKGINISIYHFQPKQKLLTSGSDCILFGNFTFENADARIRIGDRSFIGGSNFISSDEIIIGNDVLISWGSSFIDNNSHSTHSKERLSDVGDWKRGLEENKIAHYKNWNVVTKKKIVIEDNAWIGFNSIILKGVTIGKGAIVASGSVVTKDVAPFAIVGGNPAQVIGQTD